ncbi:helix-turn-helix domain-containing protein [Ihubacter sp. rT4E-8]|uniref:helix-turn-helix domain-containing protein n=1 Tax=Ihubacter sp. rT4E-8 TaxID=3242369 RepID=UPI003CF7F48B
MKRKKISSSEKITAVNLYTEGRISQKQLAEMYDVSLSSVRQWIRNYEALGNDAFQQKYKKYSKELKYQAVQDYLNGVGSQDEICRKYGIRSRSKLQLWIMMYNSGMDSKTNSSGGSATMTKGKKTTFDERTKIVEYCIAHDRNYAQTAKLFGISYQQARNYTIKYEEAGVNGLIDGR